MTALNAPLVPSFTAHRSDRKLMDYIQRAFLRNLTIDAEQYKAGWIQLEDGSKWKLLLETASELHTLLLHGQIQCIVSFQLWKDGRCWAVAREDKAEEQDHES